MSQSNYDITLIEQTGGPDNRTLRIVDHGVHWNAPLIILTTYKYKYTYITMQDIGEDER